MTDERPHTRRRAARMSADLFGDPPAAAGTSSTPGSSLQITPAMAAAGLTPQHKRFNSLIRRIAQERKKLAQWQENLDLYRKLTAQLFDPLRAQLRAGCRKWAFALDAQLERSGWSQAERETMTQLLCSAASDLLDDDDDDDDSDKELQALYAKHARPEFIADRQQAMLVVKELTQAATGLNLDGDEPINTPADLLRRMQESMRAQLEQDPERAQSGAGAGRQRKKTPAQLRREAQAQQATQSVREVYRKLASALHPDRETDPDQRAAKTALMQKVNQAYKANDLLGLLELQLQIEQIDADHVANVSAQHLEHYNRVLGEQLSELQFEVGHIALGFEMEFDLPPGKKLKPGDFPEVLERYGQELRADLEQQQRDLDMLSNDQPASKRWLKQMRKRLKEEEEADSNYDFDPFR